MHDFEINKQTFIACDSSYEEAELVLWGAPFDSTTSFRPGTRFATQAIRPDSFGLETYSPGLNLDMLDYKFCDIGDIELPFGEPRRVIDMLEERTTMLLEDGKLPLMIGGEHLLTLGPVRAMHKKYKDLCLIQFDAHTDLRTDYLGNPYSHAAVIRRCWEELGDGHIFQFGIRSGLREEFVWAKDGHTHLQTFDFSGLEEVVAKIGKRPVYFTLDLDILDPAYFPGTGTPEPGGVSFLELLKAIHLLKPLNIVGFDVNELSPHYDLSGASTAVACKIIRELMLQFAEQRRLNKQNGL